MCGICGFYQLTAGAPADERILREMLGVIQHRGPDDEGVYLHGTLAMGMRRLSIIDLAGGRQPVFNESGAIAVVFNGEIYNYRDLRERLETRGHRFATASDTEILVHAYEEYGEACVDHLRGMFAFALHDAPRRRLLVARDRLGIKPLYYTRAGEALVFGSEIKALLHYPQVDARLDLRALGHFLRLKYVPAPLTMFQGIASLPPGHLLICDGDTVAVRQYWDLSFQVEQGRPLREEEYAEQLEGLLRESVRLHLQSDVPFGAFLSGGVDSSTVVALMSQFLDEPVKTFSVGFQGEGVPGDELPYARQVAQQFATDHHEVYAGPQDFPELIERVVWHLDQPIADQALMATYLVSKLARRHVKMVLTGEGGDELFAGYVRYVGEQMAPVFQHVPLAVRAAVPAISSRVPGLRRPKIALYALACNGEADRVANWFPLFNRDALPEVLAADTRGQVAVGATDRLFAHYLAQTDALAPVNRMLYVDTKLWLADFLLLRGDKLTMAASIEARVPLLDHKLVEFAASLPPRLKIHGLTRKYLLKRVSRVWLPPAIINRKKQGFPIPIDAWFRGPARDFLRDTLAPDTIARRKLFDPPYVARLLAEHDGGQFDHSLALMGLLGVELWHRLFIDRQAGSSARFA